MSWTLLETLSIDILRAPPTICTLFTHVLPPCFSYYVVAVLVILPDTRTLRVAMWPLIIFLAFRAAVSVDFSFEDPRQTHLNVDFTLFMFYIVMRTLEWSFLKDPLKRRDSPNQNSSILIDALDLATNVRGVGWNWSKGLRFPPDTRPSSRLQFAIYVFLSILYHRFISGVFHIAIQGFAPEIFAAVSGGTIFDDTLPPLIRYARSSVISTLAAVVIYANIQMSYDINTFIGIAVVQQNPAQWPPIFDEPWKATSLHDFWGYRWHQQMRRLFIVFGGWPLRFVFGRVGYVLGSFVASGIFHVVVVAMLDRSVEWWSMLLSFGMMAVGVIIEHVITQVTGRRVGGWIGRVWTMAWLLVWGNMMVDGFVRGGLFAVSLVPFSIVASAKGIVEHYATALDRWLRACAS
ncbi:hypothetical protein EDC04DRAFT_2568328 [Pisolithus marmoratus]|nr:hypothetical protein EDC04DRAFT_2568328 [Pisolithus marmoratus]